MGLPYENMDYIDTYSAGTGLSLVGNTFNNTAPDQTVSLTGSGATSVTGTYPSFTISSTDNNTTYSAGTGMSLVGTTFNNTAPDQTVSLTGGGATTVTGTYPSFTISSPNTYLDGSGISDNYLIKVVSGATTQTNMIETSVLNTSTSLQISIPSSPFAILSGAIETEIFDTIKRRMHLTTNGIASTNGITITSDGRVGIGVVDPEEDLELDGNIQLDTGGVQRNRIIFYDKQNDHEHAEIDGLGEGTNGGVLAFYTKVDGGSVTEKIRINNEGAIGIEGPYYGTAGQVIISNGSGNPVSWADQTDTTYSAGTGLSLVGTTFNNTAPDQTVSLTGSGATSVTGTYPNFTISSTNTTYSAGTGMTLIGTTFSIGQGVGTSDSVTFDFVTSTNGFNGGTGGASWFGITNVGHIRPIAGATYTYNIGTSAAQYLVGYAFSWSSSSDDRLKDNETDIINGLDTIMKLKPQTYDFKSSEEADAKHLGLRSGFIAQDILEIPELAHAVNVPENETEKVDNDKETKCYLSLDYNTIFTHAVKAIQELNEKVKSLENEINILKNSSG
jgi:hypothetical protein